MNLKNKMVKQRIFEAWSPKIKAHLASKGIKDVSESKLRRICEAAQVRKLFESATQANTPGRGAFSFGNNPSNPSDTARGSGEQFDSLFGVFIDSMANTVGFDLVPTLQSTKSNMLVNILEPVYADGKLDSTASADMPELFQVKLDVTGTVADLEVGTSYDVLDANVGNTLLELIYVGKDRKAGDAIFRLGTVTGAGALATLLDTPVSGAGIYTDATNFVGFVASSINYVNAYTNFVSGYAGSGATDNEAWGVNRSKGEKVASPMNRATGESARYRSMGLHKWSENFSAETFHVKIGYTIEMLQDLAMEEGVDAQQVAYDTIANELDQNINNEIVDTHYAIGWGHHYNVSQVAGVNLNLHISATAQSGATTFVDDKSVTRSIPAATGALVSTTNGDNLPSMQRRIISRATYGSGVVGHRCRKGKANVAITNTRISSALQDTRSFQAAPFENNLAENENLYEVGSFRKINLFEDPMMGLEDNRISLGRKGTESDPGLKMINYILAEKVDTIAEGLMSNVSVLKSRMKLAAIGTNPEFNYLTFTVTEAAGQSII